MFELLVPRPATNSVQFSSVTQSCPTLCGPKDCSMPGFPVHAKLPELAQTRVHWVSDAIQPSHLLSSLLPLSIFPSIRVFSFLFFFICSEFCHTLKWNSHGFTCVPHPDPPSHLPLHLLPSGSFLSQFFTTGGLSIGASASALVLLPLIKHNYIYRKTCWPKVIHK